MNDLEAILRQFGEAPRKARVTRCKPCRATKKPKARTKRAQNLQRATKTGTVPKATRSRGRAAASCDIDAVSQTVDFLERDPDAIPQPLAAAGCRPRACAADAPVWGEAYRDAVAEATEVAAIEAGDDDAAFRRSLRKQIEAHPMYPLWALTDAQCIRDFRSGHERKRRRTETATSEAKQRVRAVRGVEGYDLTGSAAHLDELTPSGRAKYYRRVGNIAEARRIEAEIRAKKRSALRR